MFKAYCDTCIIFLAILPYTNSVRSQEPICSLTIECPNKSQVCIQGECLHLANASTDAWIFAYGAIAVTLLVLIFDRHFCSKIVFSGQVLWLGGCYYLCWWCPGSQRFAHPDSKVTWRRRQCYGKRLSSWWQQRVRQVPKVGKTVQVVAKSEQHATTSNPTQSE